MQKVVQKQVCVGKKSNHARKDLRQPWFTYSTFANDNGRTYKIKEIGNSRNINKTNYTRPVFNTIWLIFIWASFTNIVNSQNSRGRLPPASPARRH